MRLTPGERVKVESQPRRDGQAAGQAVNICQSWQISVSCPAQVEEVMMRHRESFARDAEVSTMGTPMRLKQGARGTLGRVL